MYKNIVFIFLFIIFTVSSAQVKDTVTEYQNSKNQIITGTDSSNSSNKNISTINESNEENKTPKGSHFIAVIIILVLTSSAFLLFFLRSKSGG